VVSHGQHLFQTLLLYQPMLRAAVGWGSLPLLQPLVLQSQEVSGLTLLQLLLPLLPLPLQLLQCCLHLADGLDRAVG
jgi:hypothetical protein